MIDRMLSFVVSAPQRPLQRITIYYFVLSVLVAALVMVVPSAMDGLVGGSVSAPSGMSFDLTSPNAPQTTQGRFGVTWTLLASMVAAFMLMMPVSWSYMGPRRFIGFDQSVVQTIMLLPIVVAGIIVMVKTSTALAFSLAGIVAGVRFRSNLKTTADGLYVFAAIGVGFATGIGEIAIAAIISMFFTYAVLLLWRCGYGTCPVGGPMPEFSAKKKKKKVEEQ